MKKKLIITISVITSLVLAIIISLLLIGNKEETYTIIFNSDGGTKIENQIVQKGEKVKKPSDPQKEGYKFIAWLYQDATYDFLSEVTSDMELKAKWYKIKEEVKEYTIKFNSDGGTTIENQIVEEGQKVIRPEDPIKEGYKFSGWYLNDEEFNFDNEVNTEIELKAKWEKVKVPANNNSTNNVSNNNASNNKEETIKVEAPTLSSGHGSGGIEVYVGFTISLEGYYKEEWAANTISGWELYEKVGSKYNLVNGTQVSVDIGEVKTYVARAYKLNKKNEKVYSAYSNEYKVDNSRPKTPTLTIGGGTESVALFTISLEGYYKEAWTSNTISGWELYEKVGSKYNLVNGTQVSVDIGESKTYVARTYALNKNNEKIYSAYSNEIIIDNN